jgi:bifunctional DNA-binding transcriptional regulator/antitoxin component of YhaV-PrlF toxin-antitoxin module
MPRNPPSGEPATKPRLIDSQNRVTLPGEVLEALGVGIGDYVAFDIKNGIVSLHRVRWALDKT